MVVQIASPKCPWADSEEGAATLEQPQGKKQGLRACKARQGSPTATQAPFTARHPACSWLGVEVGAPEPALARGARGGDGVLPNPHIRGPQPRPGYPGAVRCKGHEAAVCHPPPPAPIQSIRSHGRGFWAPPQGPAVTSGTHLPRALRHGAPWAPGVRVRRRAGGPRYSGRRPAGSAPPRQKICWAGWLVLWGMLSPRGAARPVGLAPPSSGGLPGAHGGH